MGVVEEAKGRVKQAVADVTDNSHLKAEGEAQAEKGAEERKQTEAQAKAKTHEEKAEYYEQKQDALET
jgi:uncharacterized protein YjbJ (UPF0337 family)